MKLYRNIKENSMVKESLVASHWGREIGREEFMIFLIKLLITRVRRRDNRPLSGIVSSKYGEMGKIMNSCLLLVE
jgi:hypothetical protein